MDNFEVGGTDDFAFSDKSIRRGFIKKVYAILTLQLIITFGMVCIFYYVDDIRLYVTSNQAVFWVALGLQIALFIGLVCTPNLRRNAPWNYIFLILFTLCEGYLLGTCCAYYQEDAVIKAVVTTIVIVIALTLFAFQTKIDFTMMTGALFSITMGLIMFGLMAAIFRSDFLYNMYAVLGAVLFSVYIVVDTQLMMGGKHALSISPEEYIFAALNLYLDIINLFLFLLRIFSE